MRRLQLTSTCETEAMSQVVLRKPENDEELWWVVKAIWGYEIPRVAVCTDKGHRAPFDAFADAFFARHPTSIWKASRGLGGKSTLMSLLVLTEATMLGAAATVLGGSATQSQRVHELTRELWERKLAPKNLWAKEPTTTETVLSNGGKITALLASQKSVRGPHPQRLRLDEADEIEMDLLRAAQGQPLPKKGPDGETIQRQTVISSTHQYPAGTMTQMLQQAEERGWPVYEWCWRESVGTADHPGWADEDVINEIKNDVSAQTWEVEYDLQEPSFEGRAIVTACVDKAFDPLLGSFAGRVGETCLTDGEEVEAKRDHYTANHGIYVTGIDWAKERDATIIRTFEASYTFWREVSFIRLQRLEWPEQIDRAMHVLQRFPGYIVHDATGLGNVITDLLRDRNVPRGVIVPFVMTGQKRSSMLNEYVAAIEEGLIKSPRIDFAYLEHKYATFDQLFGRDHTPDSVVSGALAWSLRKRLNRQPVAPATINRDTTHESFLETDRPLSEREGDVSVPHIAHRV